LLSESFGFLQTLLAAHIEEVILGFQVGEQREGKEMRFLLLFAFRELRLYHDFIEEEELSLVDILI
jgi:hypothetical protein